MADTRGEDIPGTEDRRNFWLSLHLKGKCNRPCNGRHYHRNLFQDELSCLVAWDKTYYQDTPVHTVNTNDWGNSSLASVMTAIYTKSRWLRAPHSGLGGPTAAPWPASVPAPTTIPDSAPTENRKQGTWQDGSLHNHDKYTMPVPPNPSWLIADPHTSSKKYSGN